MRRKRSSPTCEQVHSILRCLWRLLVLDSCTYDLKSTTIWSPASHTHVRSHSLSISPQSLQPWPLNQPKIRSCEHSDATPSSTIVADHESQPLPRSCGASLQFRPILLISPIIQRSPCRTSQIGSILYPFLSKMRRYKYRRQAICPGHRSKSGTPVLSPIHTHPQGYARPGIFLRFLRSVRRSK